MNTYPMPNQANIPGEATAQLSTRRQVTLSVLWFGLNFQTAALFAIVLPVQILLFVTPGQVGNAQQAVLLGWLSVLGGLVSLFLPPLVGALSDRTSVTLGRRRPYVLVGTAIELLGAWVLATPSNLGFLLAGLLIFEVGNNVCTAGYQGMLPDLVPESQRGEASGYVGLMTILGNAASFGLAAVLLGGISSNALSPQAIRPGVTLYYLLSGLVLGIGALVTLFWVHETRYAQYDAYSAELAGRVDYTSVRTVGRRLQDWFDLWLTPWQKRDFTLVFLTRTSVMLGISVFMTFIAYYFANVAQVTNFVQETAALAVLALGGAAASALVLGILSDRLRHRIGRVSMVCGATACMSLAALSFVVFPAGAPLWPMGILFGVGLGAYFSVDWALAVDVLPSADSVGKDMGIWSIASTLPAIIAPFVGAVVLDFAGLAGHTTLGYRLVFCLAVALLVAGAVCVLLVRDQLASPDAGQASANPPARSLSATRRRVSPGWRLAFRTRSGKARGFLRFWPFWEFVTMAVNRQQTIPNAPFDLLRVQFTRFHGRALTLPDGTSIQPGDRIVELHIHNRVMAQAAGHSSSWRLLSMLVGDLRALAKWSATSSFPADVHAIYGYTLLSRGAPRLGFTVRGRPRSLRSRLDGFFLMGLLVLYHPAGRNRLNQGTTYGREPVEVWMSRRELDRGYGAQE